MSVITAVKPQKFTKRVNIFIDGKFAFGLDLENYIKFELKVGQELSEDKIAEITGKAEYQKILERALIFATIRPRSEKEIDDWMVRKKVTDEYKKKLKDKLFGLDFINDEKFAEWWIEQRQSFRPKPKSIMYNELRKKGIKKDIIDKVLGETKVDEIKIAKDLIEKRGYKWKGLGKLERRQKVIRYFAGKGFKWDIIKGILENEKT